MTNARAEDCQRCHHSIGSHTSTVSADAYPMHEHRFHPDHVVIAADQNFRDLTILTIVERCTHDRRGVRCQCPMHMFNTDDTEQLSLIDHIPPLTKRTEDE